MIRVPAEFACILISLVYETAKGGKNTLVQACETFQ